MATPVEQAADRQSARNTTSVTKPTNLVVGNVIGIWVVDYDAASATPAISGFTLVDSVREATSNAIWLGYFERVVTGAEGSTFAITSTGGSYTAWVASRITGVASGGGRQLDVKAHGVSTDVSIPSFTTVNTNNLALWFHAGYDRALDPLVLAASVTWLTLIAEFDGVDDYCYRAVSTATTVNSPSSLPVDHATDAWCSLVVVYSDTAAATGGTTLTGLANSSQAQTAATVTLTQHAVLSGLANSTQAQTAATVTLTPHTGGTTLTGLANSSQAQTAATVTLTQHAVLSGLANSTQAQTAATVSFAIGLWPTSIAADNRTVLNGSGVPWYAIADCASSGMAQLSNTEQDQYLADRAAKGITAIWVELIEHKFADHAPNDINNVAPFTGTAFQSTLNPTYWARVDRFLSQAGSFGITVLAFPAYLGAVGSGEGWETELSAASNAQATSYGTTIGTRYAGQPNIIWMYGGDQNPNATLLDRTDHLALAIRAAGAVQLTSTHQVRNSSGHDVWSAYTWRDLNSVYVNPGFPSPVTQFETVYAQEAKPVVWIEGRFENESGFSNQLGRAQIYATMFEHGAFHMFGTTPTWFFGSSTGAGFGVSTSPPFDTWQHALNSPLSLDAQRAATFLASYTPAQRQALIPGVNLAPTGEGTGSTKAAIGCNTTGGQAWAYFPSSRSITLDLSVFTPSSLRLRWFDPTNATYTTIGTFANTAGRTVTYPSANSAGDADWVLVVDPVAASHLKIGTTDVTAMKVGTTTATKAYIGTTQVWP